MHGNPHEEHTLKRSVSQTERLPGWKVEHIFCDRGYKGAAKELPEKNVHTPARRNNRDD